MHTCRVKHVVLCAHDNTLEEWALVGRAWSRVGVREIHTCVFAVEEADACSANCEAAGASQGTSAQRRLQVIGMVQQRHHKGVMRFHYLTPDTRAFSQTRANATPTSS
jgi:hypothetical protein